MSTTTGPTSFDPLDPAYVVSPYAAYGSLRDHDPVHWSELLSGWVVTRFDDVAAILRDPSMSSDINKATPNPTIEHEIEGLLQHGEATQTIVHLDDPDHARVRKLMAEPFRVREVNRLASVIEQRVGLALDRLREQHGPGVVAIDLIADLAYPLPVEIFSEWLGVPEEANPQFRTWTSWVARSRDPMGEQEHEELFAAWRACTSTWPIRPS
jgi:cytochrome P450